MNDASLDYIVMRSDEALKPVAATSNNDREDNFDSRNVATLVQPHSNIVSNSTTLLIDVPTNMKINFE